MIHNYQTRRPGGFPAVIFNGGNLWDVFNFLNEMVPSVEVFFKSQDGRPILKVRQHDGTTVWVQAGEYLFFVNSKLKTLDAPLFEAEYERV